MVDDGSFRDNPAKQQYELSTQAGTALAAYDLREGVIAFTHTEVPPEMEGQGIGGKLVGAALEDVRQRGLKVLPFCSFVKHFIDTHPEAQDLLKDA